MPQAEPEVSDRKASMWYVMASGAGFGATFVQTFYLAFVFDPVAFGRVSLFLAVFSLGSAIFAAGLDGAILRFFFDADAFPDHADLVRHVLALWGCAVAALGAVAIGAGFFVVGPDRALQLVFATEYLPAVIAASVFSWAAIVRQLFIAQRRPRSYAALLVGSRVALLAVIIMGTVMWGASVFLVAMAHLLVAAVLLVVLGWNVRPGPGQVRWARLRALIRYSWPLSVNTLGGVAFSSGYRLVLAAVVSLEQLGIFNLASQISSVTYLTGSGITRGYLPRAYQRLEDTGGDRRAVRFYLRVVVITALVLGVVVLLAGTGILGVFKGGQYLEARVLLPWLVGGQCLLIMKGYAYAVATYYKRTGVVTVTSLAGAVLTVALTVPLVRQYGLSGAAAAVLAGFGVQVGVLTVFARTFRT